MVLERNILEQLKTERDLASLYFDKAYQECIDGIIDRQTIISCMLALNKADYSIIKEKERLLEKELKLNNVKLVSKVNRPVVTFKTLNVLS